jgi:hypothetical protein
MDQKEDLISQHDTLKKSVRRSYSSKQAYIRGKPIWWHMLSTDWILPDID